MPSLLLKQADLKRDFYPLTLTREVSDLRIGILTVKEKWELLAAQQGIDLQWIEEKQDGQADKVINANLIPGADLNLNEFFSSDSLPQNGLTKVERLWDVISINKSATNDDIRLLTFGRMPSEQLSNIRTSGNHPLYISKTANIEHCTINLSEGPVYIDDHALIMDGAMLRGPVYIGKNSVVKMGATIYGGTSIGNDCVIAGEVKNSIFHSYSNKAHHGYIGDSYIGAWCNLGAGTTCSNLKNTGGKIKVWDIHSRSYRLAHQKVGIFMGDHVKTAINTSFNSGTVIGPFANIFANAGLIPKFIPGFSWGSDGKSIYEMEKLLDEVDRWMMMKNKQLDSETKEIITTLYNKQQIT
ncbi:MAG: putative sugar nucleotidyl transferase [bacterium]|jgi:UDP-N-acetylglucosamine diphosphorylase/glucosamine-1-phosphate N-acetyltransferase